MSNSLDLCSRDALPDGSIESPKEAAKSAARVAIVIALFSNSFPPDSESNFVFTLTDLRCANSDGSVQQSRVRSGLDSDGNKVDLTTGRAGYGAEGTGTLAADNGIMQGIARGTETPAD